MSFENIRIGDRADISLKTYESKILQSKVENVTNAREILIRSPVINGRPRGFPDNTEISLVIYTEKGMYRFGARVIESVKRGASDMLRVSLETDGERVQRREFFRADCLLPLYFNQVTSFTDILDRKNADRGVVLDMSGGGLRFVSKVELMEGMMIKGLIEAEPEPVLITGKIIKAQRLPDNDKYEYRARLEDLPDEICELIIRYVLKLQRDQLQREQNLNRG